MKTRTTLWVIAVAVAVVAVPCWGREIVVSLHNHTYYSDGLDSPEEVCEQAIAAGAEVVGINDHAEMIDSEVLYECMPKLYSGVSNWARDLDLARQRCEQLGKKMIYGAEIGMGPNRHNHLLVWAPPELPNVVQGFHTIVDLANGMDVLTDEMFIAEIKAGGYNEAENALFAAAHPTHGNYPFCAGWYIDVYETFNHYRDNASTFDFIAANAGSPPRPKSIVAGTDYHFPGAEVSAPLARSRTGNCYVPEIKRFTVVQADDNSATSVIDAIRKRRCYAAFADARITEASCWPGGECESGTPLTMSVEKINLNPCNFFDSPGVNKITVLAVNADTGLSLRWVQEYILWDDDTGTIMMSLSRLNGGQRWYVYLDISSQIVTSAITVTTTASQRVASVSGSGENSGPRGAATGQRMTTFTPSATITPAGRKFVGQERWGDGAITATYIERDKRFGTLYLKHSPSGNIYTFPIDLTQNCMGFELCAVPERIVMEYTEDGQTARLLTDEHSMAIQHMEATRERGEYYALSFGYAFPAGDTPRVRVGGVTSTPHIELYLAP
jgi:hypothetical protein